MDYAWLIIPITVALTVHYLTVSRHQGILTLDGFFVLSQWLMSVGSLLLLDTQTKPDRLYALVMTIPFFLYISASIFSYFVIRGRSPHLWNALTRIFIVYQPTVATWGLLFVSVIVTLAYFRAVGYNVFLLGVRGLVTGGTADYTTLRLDSYSGDQYFYPGYVNQFKNIILPALTLVVALHLYRSNSVFRHIVVAPLTLVALFGILGTGQRSALVLFALVLVTFIYHMDRRRFARRVVLTASVVVPLFLISTLLLGRSAGSLARAEGTLGKIGVLSEEVLRRILYDNQVSGQKGFWYTSGQPIQNGAEWLQGIAGILPGHSGSPLASEIFASISGSDRGTSPPSMWGSVHYNFGMAGLIVMPVLLAIVYQIVTFRALNRPTANSLELIGMAGVFAVCGTWVAGGPEYLLNSGAVAFGGLWWLGHKQARFFSLATNSLPALEPRRQPSHLWHSRT